MYIYVHIGAHIYVGEWIGDWLSGFVYLCVYFCECMCVSDASSTIYFGILRMRTCMCVRENDCGGFLVFFA